MGQQEPFKGPFTLVKILVYGNHTANRVFLVFTCILQYRTPKYCVVHRMNNIHPLKSIPHSIYSINPLKILYGSRLNSYRLSHQSQRNCVLRNIKETKKYRKKRHNSEGERKRINIQTPCDRQRTPMYQSKETEREVLNSGKGKILTRKENAERKKQSICGHQLSMY